MAKSTLPAGDFVDMLRRLAKIAVDQGGVVAGMKNFGIRNLPYYFRRGSVALSNAETNLDRRSLERPDFLNSVSF